MDNDKDFDNRSFWNKRYIENPALGSGIGSRGQSLLHKRRIITQFLQSNKPDCLLDVGCGDHEVLSGVDLPSHYVGIDISEVIVKENVTKFPERRFQCIDFTTISELEVFQADMVFCLEVLIHQHSFEAYRRLVSNLVRCTRKAGLISGYISDPRPAVRSEIIAWHEPLTETLSWAGAGDIRIQDYTLHSKSHAFISFAV